MEAVSQLNMVCAAALLSETCQARMEKEGRGRSMNTPKGGGMAVRIGRIGTD